MHFFPVRASLLCLNTSSSSLPVIHIRHAVHTPYTCTLGARGVGTAAPLPHSRRAVSAPTWRGSGRWWAGQRRGEEITCKIICMKKFPTMMRGGMLPTGPRHLHLGTVEDDGLHQGGRLGGHLHGPGAAHRSCQRRH